MAGDCFGRTPFGSVIATVLCGIGVGLFCSTLFMAIEITFQRIFQELFHFRVEWLKSVQIAFIMIGVVMGLFAAVLLIFGILSTGATRKHVYSGEKCIMGGRVSALIFLGLTYITNCAWLFMSCLVSMVVIFFIMLVSVCAHEIEGQSEAYLDTYCLNLSRFGIYRNYTEGVDKNALCDYEDLDRFCKNARDATPLYGVALAGSLIIVISLVLYVINLTTNYNQIKTTKEVTEFREVMETETAETVRLDNIKDSYPYARSRSKEW